MNKGAGETGAGQKKIQTFLKTFLWYLCGPKFGDGKKVMNVLTFR